MRAISIAPPHDRDAERRERAELGADHHRADDQDRRVGEDPDRGEQRRDHHEGRKLKESSVLSLTVSLDLLPEHRVRGESLRLAHRLARRERDRRVDASIEMPPVSSRPSAQSCSSDEADVLARDVGVDHVSCRLDRRPGNVDDVRHGDELAEEREHLRDECRRDDQAGRMVTRATVGRNAADGAGRRSVAELLP